MRRLVPALALALLVMFAWTAVPPLLARGVGAGLPPPLQVPRGRHVLLDGRVEAEEWRDAREVALGAGFRLLAKRDPNDLYLALIPPEPRIFGVNLYMAAAESSGPYLNLHASAKLGERSGRRGAWPAWDWWNQRGWSANVARFNAFEGQRFLPDAAKELQISLERLPGSAFLLAVEVEGAGGADLLVAGGPVLDGMHWLALELSAP